MYWILWTIIVIACVCNSRSFQKIANFKFAWVCVCVCVRAYVYVYVYVYVCINVTNQNNVIVATCKTQYRVLLLEMWRNFKRS